MLRSLLLVCAVLGAARHIHGVSHTPGPSPTGPHRIAPGSPPAATLDQVASELSRIVEASVSSATAAALQRITESLGDMQRELAAVSARLDSVSSSQTRLEKAHSALLSSLSSWQESHADILNRLSLPQSHHASTGSLPPRPVSVNVSQDVDPGSGSPPESSLGQAGVTEPPTTAAVPVATTTTEKAAVRPVLGQWCGTDSDCTPLQPETECGERRVCSCQSSYRQVSATECRRRSGLSEPCTEDADCKTPDSACTGAACNCTSNFWNYNNEACRRRASAREGRPCRGDPDCDIEGGLECLADVCKCKAAIYGQYEFRVAGAGSCTAGRAELRLSGGLWGFVCDDSWSGTDASVFCRSLGYKYGKAFNGSKFGRGKRFFMDEVNCNGTESHLLRCSYQGWGIHNCNADEVASVTCA